MSIKLNINGEIKNTKSIFVNVNGEKKKIKEVYAEKDGLPLLVYPEKFILNGKYYMYTRYCFLYSEDGISWTRLKTNGLPDDMVSYVFAHSDTTYILFNAYVSGGDYYISTDFINWKHYDTIFQLIPNDSKRMSFISGGDATFVYVGDRFIAIKPYASYKTSNNSINAFMEQKYSLDGITWNDMNGLKLCYKTPTYTNSMIREYLYKDFYYLNGTYVCNAHSDSYLGYTSSDDTLIYYSTDGIKWNVSTSYLGEQVSRNTIYLLNNLFLREYYHNKNKKPYLYSSSDGIHWNSVDLPFTYDIHSIDYFDNKYMIHAYNGIMYCSENLQEWSKYCSDVPYSKFIKTDDILISYDGYNLYYYDKINSVWNEITKPDVKYINDLKYINGMFFLIDNNMVFTSSSGINYTPWMCSEDFAYKWSNTILYIT